MKKPLTRYPSLVIAARRQFPELKGRHFVGFDVEVGKGKTHLVFANGTVATFARDGWTKSNSRTYRP